MKSYLFLFSTLSILLSTLVSSAQTVYQQKGNIHLKNSEGVEIQATSSGLDFDPSLSPDGKWIVFIRDTPDKILDDYHETELLLINTDSMNEIILVKGGISNDPNNYIVGMKIPQFLSDSQRVVFYSSCAPVRGNINLVDIRTGVVQYICDGNSVEAILSGKYRDQLIVLKHGYFLAGGTFNWYWLIALDGKEIGPIGEADNLSMFKEMYVNIEK